MRRLHWSKDASYTLSWVNTYRRQWLLNKGSGFFRVSTRRSSLYFFGVTLASIVEVCNEFMHWHIRRNGSIIMVFIETNLLRRIESLGTIGRELTTLAQTHRDVDLRWWIDVVVHNTSVLAQLCRGLTRRLSGSSMHLRFMAAHRGCGAPAIRWQQRQRHKKLVFDYPRGAVR